ncbi:hypothetical protein PUN28_012312 [Cardiocondyla obscurior]|uniref:Uncharacterized protein n=1 Tax=Cardiocondyla obscurior TaxID=286306 RepID=A0AAW2FAP4_9HYME
MQSGLFSPSVARDGRRGHRYVDPAALHKYICSEQSGGARKRAPARERGEQSDWPACRPAGRSLTEIQFPLLLSPVSLRSSGHRYSDETR